MKCIKSLVLGFALVAVAGGVSSAQERRSIFRDDRRELMREQRDRMRELRRDQQELMRFRIRERSMARRMGTFSLRPDRPGTRRPFELRNRLEMRREMRRDLPSLRRDRLDRRTLRWD